MAKITETSLRRILDEHRKAIREEIGEEIRKNIREAVTEIREAVSEEFRDSIFPNQTTKMEQLLEKENESLRNEIHEARDEILNEMPGDYGTCTCSEEVEEKLDETTKELSDKLTRAKLEMFSVIEKEGQITRDLQQPTAGVPIRNRYVCDFFVENFASRINSGEIAYSFPWHIEQLRSSVQSRVEFKYSGDMEVGLKYFRHPRQLGLEPRSGVKLQVTVSVTDTSNTLTDIQIGSHTDDWDEAEVENNGDRCTPIGTVDCQELINAGFANKEGYEKDAILIRYHIRVV